MTNQALIARAREVIRENAYPCRSRIQAVDDVCTLAEALLAENASLHAMLDGVEDKLILRELKAVVECCDEHAYARLGTPMGTSPDTKKARELIAKLSPD